MTWRLENSLIRGELFNLRPNHVHGWLELVGAPSLIHLGLTGNMEGELFGKRVQFETALADEEGNEYEKLSRLVHEAPAGVESGLPDLEALEIQQIGPTGAMQLIRSPAANGDLKEEVRLTLQWYSQNGEMWIELVNPRIEFVAEDEDEKKSAHSSDEDDEESV